MEEKKYCCERFERYVKKKQIIYAYQPPRPAGELNETAWITHDLWNIYYCPFCGSLIKGKGWGTYDKTHPPKR